MSEKVKMKRYLLELGCSEDDIEKIRLAVQLFNAKEVTVMELPKDYEPKPLEIELGGFYARNV